MKFFAPATTHKFNVHGREYEAGEDGTFEVEDASHQQVLRILGCKTEEEHAVEQIKADAPVPEDMVDPEVVKALIEENEVLKRQHADLSAENDALRHRLEELTAAHEELKTLAATMHTDLEAARAAPETATETQGEAKAASEAPDFAAMAHADRKTWLADNGVSVPGNVSGELAIEACNKRYAELNA